MDSAGMRLRRAGLVVLSFAAPGGGLSAATVVWTGTGGDAFWSNPANWAGAATPRDGDAVVLGAGPSFESIVDNPVGLASLTYATMAPAIDVHAGGGRALTLTFSGAGIVNNSAASQNVFADAGSGATGATVVFANTASVTGSAPTTLTARGATAAGAGGGAIVFQDHSSTALNRNATNLFAEGATVAGAGGGALLFRGDAYSQDSTQLTVLGSRGTGAVGGQMTVQERARVESGITVLQGDNGGYGGRLDVRDSGVLANGLLQNFGASSTLAGGEAVTRLFDNSTFGDSAQNDAGRGAGFAGGRIEFHGHAVFDGGSSSAQIVNQGASMSGAGSGRTLFLDDSSAAQVGIFNDTAGQSTTVGLTGGSTEFHDRSHAGQASIVNDGANAGTAGTLGGRTLFFDHSSAESAQITNNPGYTPGAPGGVTVFADNASAGSATLSAYGVGVGLGGRILLQDSASGGTARVITNAGGVVDISALTTSGTTLGSIEGGGTFFLGSKGLGVGGNLLSTEVSGVLRDGGQAGGTGGSLGKFGSGALTLSGANTYTGATTVNAGALYVNGSIGGSGVGVGNGATLGGAGTISAPVAVAAGATLAPGAATAPGTLRIIGNLTLDPAAQLSYRLGAPGVVGGPLNDLVSVSGNLTLAGTLNVANSGAFGLGSYRLVDYGGALTDRGLTFGTLPGGVSAGNLTIQTSVAGQVNLVAFSSSVLFWDGSHPTANGAVDGGTGRWDNTTTNWTVASAAVNLGWSGHFAVFTGPAGTVTVAAPVATTGLQFATSGYTVNADPGASIALTGAATVRVDPGASATLNAPLTGSGSLVKADTGTLTLGGNSSYSGGTTLQGGTVIVTNAAGTAFGTGPVTLFATATQVLDFVGNASAGGVSFTSRGGPTLVAAYIRFADNATAGSAKFDNQGSTADGGLGGQLNFVDNSSAVSATIINRGSAFAPPTGAFSDSGAGTTLFANNATAGNAIFSNMAGLAGGGLGGHTFFTQSSSAGASSITNEGGAFASGGFGATIFSGSSRAGSATIINLGATSTGAGGGYAEFGAGTTADSATFLNSASALANGAGGYVQFLGNATAGSATFTQAGGSTVNSMIPAEGGVVFQNTSSAASGTFYNLGATAAGAVGGLVVFSGSSTAASSAITNRAGALNGGFGGSALFENSATAGNATITLEGGTTGGARGGTANFLDNATAASATLIANGGSSGGTPGLVSLAGSASGGSSRVVLAGGSLDITGLTTAGTTVGSLEGNGGNVLLGSKRLTVGGSNTSTSFGGSITGSGAVTKTGTGTLTLSGASAYTGGTLIADGAIVVTNAAGLALGTGPVVQLPTATSELRFIGSGAAGGATITDTGSASNLSAVTTFADTATAATATLVNQGNSANFGFGGVTVFRDASTAGSAVIINAGTAFLAPGPTSFNGAGLTSLRGTATAGSATIVNASSLTASTVGGQTIFDEASTAGSSTITSLGGSAAGRPGGQTTFYGSASAGSSTLFANGGAVGGAGSAFTVFTGTSTAGNATLYAGTAPAGGFGGSVVFAMNSTGGSARAIVQGGAGLSPGGLDISELAASGMTIGSIEGGGIVSLGSRNLQVGGNGRSTTFAGLIRDGGFVAGTGGALSLAGAGAVLELTGANTYTGGTRIGDGVDANSGKLVAANPVGSATGSGPVVVERGGTLSGTGRIGGPVTLNAGGLIAPGDPATLTFEGDLTWNGGGVIQLVLGADQAASDLVSVLGHLVRGTDGEYRFNLVDAGFEPGQRYELVSAGELVGFSAGDFTVSGLTGRFEFVNGALDFSGVAAAVPEPGSVWLMLVGLLLLAGAQPHLRARRSGVHSAGSP